jgi:hypothetical protein
MKRFASAVVLSSLVLVVAPELAYADDAAPPPPPPPSPVLPAAPATTGVAPAVAATQAQPAETQPQPVVELTADDGRATIERRASTSSPTVPILETGVISMGHWEHACVAPCQMRLDPRYAYRVAGDGLVPTDSFALPRGQDRVRVDAKMGSSMGRVVGVLATAGGALAIAGGGLALAATPILESEDVGSKGFRTGVLASGVGLVSVGVVAATVGLFLWLSNGSSARAEPTYARQQAAR